MCVVRSRRDTPEEEEFEEQGGVMSKRQTPSESTDREKRKVEKLSGSDTANNLGSTANNIGVTANSIENPYPEIEKRYQ